MSVQCTGANHSIKWRRGKLILADHDVPAERAMVALGAEPCECLTVLDAWVSAMGNLDLLVGLCMSTNWARPGTPFAVRRISSSLSSAALVRATLMRSTGGPSGAPTQAVIKSLTAQWQSRAASQERSEVIFSLPEPFRRRLIASLIASASRSKEQLEENLDYVLKEKVTFAVAESIRYWAGPGSITRLTVDVHVEMGDPGEAPFLLSQVAAKSFIEAGARLPLSWLQQVWARDVAVVEGCFVLEILEASHDGTTLAVNAARWHKDRTEGLIQVVRPARVVIMEDGPHLWWTGS